MSQSQTTERQTERGASSDGYSTILHANLKMYIFHSSVCFKSISNSLPPTWNLLLSLQRDSMYFAPKIDSGDAGKTEQFVFCLKWNANVPDISDNKQPSPEKSSRCSLSPLHSQAYQARAAAGGVSHPPQHQPQRRRLLPEQPDGVHQGRQRQTREEVSVTQGPLRDSVIKEGTFKY